MTHRGRRKRRSSTNIEERKVSKMDAHYLDNPFGIDRTPQHEAAKGREDFN